mmetsp:Transcript_34566/g.87208  ORF Transcript_34566/g.87208 Transcript_34566/m.87208 type:complete len:172 (+) Transcript_34566:728-1243(+)
MLIQRGDINVPLEQVKLSSLAGMVFEHIRDLHLKGVHAKLKKLHKMILGRYCNIPRRVVKLFCETCVTCAKHRTTKAKAGHRPILSKGMFGARGQIDLIDYQSSEYKGYRFLLTYIDHGIKFCFCTPIPNKEKDTIAGKLFLLFFLLGPPVILQADNGREFSVLPTSNRAR